MEDPPVVDEEYLRQIENARRVLRGLVTTMNYASTLHHLAWLDAKDYDINTNTGGVNGSLVRNGRLVQKYRSMKQGMQIIERLKTEHPRITYADLIQLGGVVAVEFTGGPTIDFVPGRKDSLAPQAQPPVSRQGENLMRMCNRMGLSVNDIVVLIGARDHKRRMGCHNGYWFMSTAMKFDNSYFVELLEDEEDGQDIPETDRFLLKNPFRPYVEHYAKDEDAFFRAYAVSHKKFSELGFTPSTSSLEEEPQRQVEAARKSCINSMLARIIAFGYVIVAVIFLSYFFEFKRSVVG